MRYWFRWAECDIGFGGPKAIIPFRFCSPSIAHGQAKRTSNELKIHTRFRWELYNRRTLQALRDAASVLAFPLKIFEEGPSLSLRKGESACMATESKQIPGLVMAKLDFPLLVVSSCFRRLYGGPACIWRVASNGRFFFERLQRANGSRVDLLVDHCMRNLCKHWSTRPLITTTSSPPLSPTRSAACDMP